MSHKLMPMSSVQINEYQVDKCSSCPSYSHSPLKNSETISSGVSFYVPGEQIYVPVASPLKKCIWKPGIKEAIRWVRAKKEKQQKMLESSGNVK